MQDGITREYFGQYLGLSLDSLKPGELSISATTRRSRPEKGWGYTVAVWVFLFETCGVVSVVPDLEVNVRSFITSMADSLPNLRTRSAQEALAQHCPLPLRISHQVVLICSTQAIRIHTQPVCKRLTMDDIKPYIRLKQSLWSDLDAVCETNDIQRNILDGIAFGVFQDGLMVSAAAAPHVAHMQHQIEEVGVDTHPNYRNLGYGKAVLSHATRAILALDRIPIYRSSIRNFVSLRLAQSVGYHKFADNIEYIQA